jgi:hypothetical protein
MGSTSDQNDRNLSDRVADNEQTIGDVATTIDDLRQVLERSRRPTCPPYCAPEVGYENSGDLTTRVADIERTIGDIAKTLDDLSQALERFRRPTCPPYCAHHL